MEADLVWGTLLGGSASDASSGIVVGNSGNLYMTGHARSAAFPTTAEAFITTHKGNQDVFVAKLNLVGVPQLLPETPAAGLP